MGKLHTAAKAGNVEALQAGLAAEGAGGDTDKQGRTLLHAAALGGHLECIQLLLERNGSDVDAEDEDGNTPLHLAAGAGHVDAVKLLTETSDEDAENGEGETPAWLALRAGHADVADVLWDAGADVSLQFDAGRSYLHLAAAEDAVPAVQSLIKRGAPLDALDATRNTPLIAALQAGSWGAARALIEAGANVQAQGKDAWTPLHFCSQNASGKPGAIDVAELLVAKGAAAGARARDGSTPAAVVGLDVGSRSRKAAALDDDMREWLEDVAAQDD